MLTLLQYEPACRLVMTLLAVLVMHTCFHPLLQNIQTNNRTKHYTQKNIFCGFLYIHNMQYLNCSFVGLQLLFLKVSVFLNCTKNVPYSKTRFEIVIETQMIKILKKKNLYLSNPGCKTSRGDFTPLLVNQILVTTVFVSVLLNT